MSKKILVVDDEPQFERLIQQRFRRRIKDGDFKFLFAKNGVEALEVLEQKPGVDMVLTDINMPHMDGLSLVSRLKEIRPLLKTIIVSAYGDMGNIRTAMNLGAFDFITKPINFTDLQTTIDKTLQEAEMLKKVEVARELEEKNTRLKELDELKTQFFTNISHEFRTPLTVISGMTDQIETHPEKWMNKGMRMIRRNTRHLLQLVNQILDLGKLESGNMSLNWVREDIVPALHYLVESFQSLAETQDIQLQLILNVQHLEMDFDPEKLLRILSNLLSNAIKFTPAGGRVYLIADKTGASLQLRVKDTGIGVPAEHLPNVFDRFFQSDSSSLQANLGTGIGLSLVREFVLLMGGQIEAESEEGKGATFTIHLPIRQQAPAPSDQKNWLMESVRPVDNTHFHSTTLQNQELAVSDDEVLEMPSLLIVEDNPDVAQYLISCLEGHYQLDIAHNGQQGIDQAFEKIPDIIVSDVMMPEKDGFELCQTLKNDRRTSHIPIILLTARADAGSRIKGLERGADAYLAKPFDKKELLVRIEKLLELRENLRKRYRASEIGPEENDNSHLLEDQFIFQVREAIESNIEDENFGILELCRAVGMSRTQLHRKIKALTGRSTSNFIRSLRLHIAKGLLKTTDLNISQIAYEVGFKDPKYFSRTFTAEFGESPIQVRK